MKKMNLLMLVLSFTLSSFAFSAEQTVKMDDKTAMVLKALNNPSNPTGILLKAALTGSKAVDLNIDPASVTVTEIAENSYQVEFKIVPPEGEEMILVTISEVLVQNGQGYVFNFSAERSVGMRKYPGVSMGNR